MSQAKAFSLVFLASVFLFSCAPKEERVAEKAEPAIENTAPKKAFPVADLLAFYDSVGTFPLNVSTKGGSGDLELKEFAWKGKEIPKSLSTIFDSILYAAGPGPHGEELGAPTQMFATKKFQVSPTSVALLTRVPGYYWPSKLMLFQFDLTTNTPTHAYELADTWGDAGNSYLRESVISKTTDNTYQIQIKTGECNPIDDTLEKRHCVDSLFEGIITGNAIAFSKRLKVKDSIDK